MLRSNSITAFHETQYGKRFFDNQLTKLIKALKRTADLLEKQNKEKEKSECDH
jgi:hypothetical protein